MADDLFHFIEHLNLQRFHLVGHSYGGLISVSFALLHPGRLRSLTLADVPISGLSTDWMSCWPVLVNKLQNAGSHICRDEPYPELQILEEIARTKIWAQNKEVANNYLYTPYGWGKGSEKTGKRWLKLLSTTSARKDFRSRKIPIRDLLKIDIPTLVSYGMRSKWKSSSEVFREHLPNPQIVYVDGAGHAHPWERPGDFLQSWLDFVTNLEDSVAYSGGERRRYARHEVRLRLDLSIGGANLYSVKTVNVSLSGIMIVCHRPIEIGSRVEFFTENGLDGWSHKIRGRVVRLGDALLDSDHRIGIEFMQKGQSSRVLENWIRSIRRGRQEISHRIAPGDIN
jgi:pimeloyl-ACP methyl ester carboxylesterase